MEAKSDKLIKLTKVQNAVINCLQNGGCLITDSDHKGALVCDVRSKINFHIDNGVFWRLVDKGLIYQSQGPHFDYLLTPVGKNIATKAVEIQIH